MVNEALMELRKRNNFFLMPENELPELTACNDILKKIDAEELFSIILQLPEGYRTVLNLFVIEGYSHKEISQLLGIKESTSKSQYHKAKARLKEILTIKENNIYGTHRK
jgi:RNA polymerase sigma-70 factor (ECF subfamily)